MPRLLPVGLILLVAACGSSGGSASPTVAAPSAVPPSAAASVRASTGSASVSPGAASGDSVIVEKFKFTPAELHVAAGTKVTWTNRELSLHTVTAGTPDAPSGLFDSGTFDTGGTFEFTFADAGTYPYFCSRHKVMQGMVVVGE